MTKNGWGKYSFRGRIQTLHEHNKRVFGKIKTVLLWLNTFLLLMDCVLIQSKTGLNLLSRETGDLGLKPRSFSQPQIFFQQFCFHEMI